MGKLTSSHGAGARTQALHLRQDTLYLRHRGTGCALKTELIGFVLVHPMKGGSSTRLRKAGAGRVNNRGIG